MTSNLNNKYMLQRHRKELEDALRFDDVRDKLYSKFVLSSSDLESIDELDSNSLKVSTCLDLLLKRNDHLALDNFINSLNEMDVQIYNAMYDKLTDPKGLKKMKQEEGTQAIARGGVPRKYKSYISRREENDLKQLLSCQEVNEIIVLTGFPMVGKTTMASHVLQNPDLVFDHFKNNVFWLDLCDVTENDPSSIADNLKRLIGSITNFKNTSDWQQEHSLAWYKDLLRSKFLSLCNGGLLILDNVRSEGVIQYFDIRCKMLVIISNRECVIQHDFKQIELGNFTDEETATCFASALSVDIRDLPEIIPTLNRIHQCLEGHPQLVALVAAYLTYSEANKWNIKRWEDMLRRLQNDGDVAGRRDSQFGILQKPLKDITNMLLGLLPEELQDYFKQLVIMPEHVNISPEVLSVYWGILDFDHVEDILNRFHKLSLLERTTITAEIKYIYGLRNIFLKRLKSMLQSEFVVNCHRNLLEAYRAKYVDLAMLPNDNYIYNYYGYHLLGANLPREEFDVFLNLRFIGAKIKYCGVGEMLQDFRLYRTYITRNNSSELTKKLDAYIHFVEKCETNLLKNGLDLVQYALRITDNQIVFDDALKVARNSTQLYLTWAFKYEPHFTRTLDVHNRFETVLFANDPKLILVGTETGDIQLWDLGSRLMILKYVGHTKGIKTIKLSPCKKYFLSISHDKTFKIWKLNHKDATHGLNVEGEPLSPSLRQRDHHSFFADDMSVTAICDSSALSDTTATTSATFCNNINAKLDDNTLHLVTCRSGGKLMRWTFQEEDDFPLKGRGQLLVAAKSRTMHTFDIVASGHMFLFAYSHAEKKLYIVNPQLDDGNNYVCIISLPDSNSQDIDIRQILAVTDEVCIAIGENIHVISQYKLSGGTKAYEHQENCELSLKGSTLSCASLTEDGAYLVTGTVDGFIFLWDLKPLRIVKEFTINNRLVIGLDTYSTPDSITLLLSGSDDSTVKCWHIASDHLSQQYDSLNSTSSVRPSASSVTSRQAPQRQMLSSYWPNNYSEGSRSAIVGVMDEDNNALQIYRISQLRTDELLCSVDLPPSVANDDSDDGFNDSDVTLFELDGKALYYTCRSGALRRYDLETKSDELLWNCNTHDTRDRQIASIMCLGDNSVLIGCNRNSLTLIQCRVTQAPIMSVLLDPSTHSDDIVRIFQLHHINVRVRVQRLLVAYSSYVYVLCTECTSAYGVADSQRSSTVPWSTSVYRMETGQSGACADVRITDCILSSAETHLVLFLSNGKCDILRLQPITSELSYVSEYVFQLDPKLKVTATAISFDGQLLALGKENGDIEVIDIANKTTKIVLKEHKLPIETLLFSSKPNYVLVSAAETICWWKLQDISSKSVRNTHIPSLKSLENQLWDIKQPAFLHSMHINALDQTSKYLLSRISLSGPLKHVTASKDFTSFITLDSLGILHSFNVIA